MLHARVPEELYRGIGTALTSDCDAMGQVGPFVARKHIIAHQHAVISFTGICKCSTYPQLLHIPPAFVM